jgi:hypothetical protein
MRRNRRTLVVVAMVNGLALFCTVGDADGSRFARTSQNIRAVWGSMTFNAGPFGRVTCPVTLESSLHSRTVSKVRGTLIGYITAAVIGEAECAGGTVTRPAETLPWHWRYDSFTGTLPEIERIKEQVIGASFRLTVLGVSCLYQSTATSPLFMSSFLTSALLLHITVSGPLPLFIGEGFPCPSTMTPEGTSTTVRDPAGSNISVFLVQ